MLNTTISFLLLALSAHAAQQGITNAQIKSGANIAHDKMAALTADRAMVTNGSGKASASSTTATQIGYLNSVTSNVQTQIDGKLAVGGNAATATALAANPTDCGGGTFANAIDAQGNLTCSAPAGSPAPASSTKTADYTLTAADDEIIMACTSACTLTAPLCSTLGVNKTWHIMKVTRSKLSGAVTGGDVYQRGTKTDSSYVLYALKAFDIHCNQGSTLYVR